MEKDCYGKRQNVKGKEAKQILGEQCAIAYSCMQIVASNMFMCGESPAEIRAYLTKVADEAYNWLHFKVEQSGHGIGEMNEAMINKDDEKYKKIAYDFDYALENFADYDIEGVVNKIPEQGDSNNAKD